MNTLLRIAIGAAIAGAAVAVLMKRKSPELPELPSTAGHGRAPAGSQGFTLDELAGENREWGGGSAGLGS